MSCPVFHVIVTLPLAVFIGEAAVSAKLSHLGKLGSCNRPLRLLPALVLSRPLNSEYCKQVRSHRSKEFFTSELIILCADLSIFAGRPKKDGLSVSGRPFTMSL